MEHPEGQGGRRIDAEPARPRGAGSALDVRTAARWTALLPTLLAPIVPKCPLCLAPLAAAAGLALPSGLALDVLVFAAAGGWALLQIADARSRAAAAGAALAAAALLAAGRVAGLPVVAFLGGGAMLVLTLARLRARSCAHASSA